jgi:hypothetical protein
VAPITASFLPWNGSSPARQNRGMDSSHLTREQIEAIEARVRLMLRYLSKLGGRMDYHGWTPDDKLRTLTWAARNALHDLACELHELKSSGVGRKPRSH